MPTYKVTDPTTGKVLKITGDSPPSEQELETVFASVKESPSQEKKSLFDTTFGTAVMAGLKTLDPTGLSQTRAVESRPEVLPLALGAAGSVLPIPGGGAAGAGAGEFLRQGIQISKGDPNAPQSLKESGVRAGLAALPFIAGPAAGRAASVLPMLRGPVTQGVIQGGAAAAAPSVASQAYSRGEISPGETIQDTITGATTGGALSMLLPALLGGKNLGRPQIPRERLRAIAAANKEGVPLTAADITGSRPLALMESGLHKTPFGSGPIQRFRQGQLEKVEAVRENLARTLGTDEPASVVGGRMKESFQKELKARGGQARESYAARDKMIPPNAPVALKEAEKAAQTVLYRQSKLPPSERDATLTGLASDILNRRGRMDFEALDIARQSIGSKVDKTFAGKEYLSLVKAIDDDLNNFASALPGNPAQLTAQAKEQYKNFKQFEENPQLQALQSQNPEDVVPAMFGRRKTTEIRTLKEQLPDAFATGKQAFSSQLLKSPNLSKELSKYDPETLREIYTPRELSKINRLSGIKNLTQTAEKLAGNPAGTAQILTTNASMLPLLNVFTDPVGSIAKLGLTLGGPAAASRAYLSGAGTKALSRGIPIPKATEEFTTAARNAIVQGLLQRKAEREKSKPR